MRVLTQNLYVGTDLRAIFEARTAEAMVAAAARAVADAEASRADERARAAARVVRAHAPDVVALQEAALWKVGDRLVADMLAAFLDELAGGYREAVTLTAHEAAAPLPDGTFGALAIRNSLLVRAGLEVGETASARFATALTLRNELLGDLSVPRGWVSVHLPAPRVTVVATHLERAEPWLPAAYPVQAAQARELVEGPGAAPGAVVLLGDFNADAERSDPGTAATYDALVGAGFEDAWRGPGPGLSWRCGDEIRDPEAPLCERIDLVLTRGCTATRAWLDLGSRLPEGLWPSDHLALLADLDL